MALLNASLAKIDFVLEIARKDPQFMNDLKTNAFKTIQESGIDLTTNESLAVIDVVNNTGLSTLAHRLTDLKSRWVNILGDVQGGATAAE